jgi:low temperature requirement protein LtrA
VGAAEQPISGPLLVAAILGMAALGVEGVLAHAGDREPLGVFYALPLVGGVVLYLAGQLLFKRRMHNALSLPRLVAICVLLVALPAAVLAPPLVGLAGLVLILAALIVVETTRYAQTRRSLRGT